MCCAKLPATFRASLPVRTTLILMILTLSVAGCGYKGPLYLPKDSLPKDKPVAAKHAPKPPAATPAAEPSATTPSP
ncbi:MAG: LPS translocon maturation chaperone LptM [Betaproteobacteria bacterium]